MKSFRLTIVAVEQQPVRSITYSEYVSVNSVTQNATHIFFLRSNIVMCDMFGCKVQLKGDDTRWRTGGEVNGKLANGVCSQYPSHYLGTCCVQHYYRWCAHLSCQQSTELTPSPADLNGIVRFAERRNVGSARVPSHFKRGLPYFSTLSHKRHDLKIY